MKSGIDLILQKRKEHLEKHRISVEDDVAFNTEEQLAYAAETIIFNSNEHSLPPLNWSKSVWEHMLSKSYKERLIIAGALLAAEIDRIQYPEK